MQAPATHSLPLVQAMLQPPQCISLVCVSAQVVPQVVSEQVALHAPCEQKGVAPLHTVPQEPQLFASSSGFTHAPPQELYPVAHAQDPATHCVPAAQELSQEPQFELLESSS